MSRPFETLDERQAMTCGQILLKHFTDCRNSPDRQKKNHWTTWNTTHRQAFSSPIVSMISGLAEYADNHEKRYENKIARDGYAGPLWYDTARNLKHLLNCETGGLDGQTCDRLLTDLMLAAGFTIREIECDIDRHD
jgi:hypothetical protein